MRHHKQPPASPISFVANVARMPQKGLPVVIEADEKQREALAEAHGLRAVKSLRAELMVTAWRRNGVRVAGTVVADIVQTCVVSLEPVENHIEEEVQGLFLPEDSKLGRLGFDGGGEIMLDVEGPDSPETFAGDTIDVGALAEEYFGLAIDPYPRKQGAAISSSAGETEEPVEGELRRKLRAVVDKS